MRTNAIRTDRLAVKLFCYTRQRMWDVKDNLPPLISDVEMNALSDKLREADPEQLKRIERMFHAC
jgi:hypothetical protein